MSESSTIVETAADEEGKPESAVAVIGGEIGVTKADAGNMQEAAGSVTGEIDDTKAEVGATGKGVVTAAAWNKFVFAVNPIPPVGSGHKAESTGAMISKERVPDSFIDKLKSRPVYKKLPPLYNDSGVMDRFPKTRDMSLAFIARWNYLVDLHVDVLKQFEEQQLAEVGVDFTDGEDLHPSQG